MPSRVSPSVTAPWPSRIAGSGEEAPDQLLARPSNWRIHPDSQRDALAGLLGQVGWVRQILEDRRTGQSRPPAPNRQGALTPGVRRVPRRLVALGEPGRLLALDPGTDRMAWIAFDLVTRRPLGPAIDPNDDLLPRLRRGGHAFDLVVIEKVESFGTAVGAEVFETVFWSGRFAEAVDPTPVERIGRKAVKLALCGDPRARDPNVRQALIDR